MIKRIVAVSVTIAVATTLAANPIDPQRALSLAAQFKVPGHEMTMQKMAPMRRATSKSAPYYVVSRGHNQGYVFVAGDDCIPTILGYAESGNFDESREAPQLLAMLNHYANVVETLQAQGLNAPLNDSNTRRAKTSEGRVNIPTIMTSHWHQSAPYNNRTPVLADGNRSLTGCVATAGAQVFYYWRNEMPRKLPATTPTYSFGTAPVTAEYQLKKGTPLKWELMCDSYNSQPEEYRDAVAVFMAAIGMQTYLEYGPSTGGHIWKLPFEQYGLHATQLWREGRSDSMWESIIYSDLLKGHPVVYSGYSENGDGHALVIDGFRASGDLFHFNYGWGGQSDGYYTVKEAGANLIEFSSDPCVMYDIYPQRYTLKTSLELPQRIFAGCDNDVTLTVTNNSRHTPAGYYLFANNTGAAPKSLDEAYSKDEETVVDPGKTQELTLKVKPTSATTCHIFITDEYLNVIASATAMPEKVKSNLWITKVTTNTGGDTETHNTQTYDVAYHTRSEAVFSMHNRAEAPFEGAFRMRIWSSDDEGLTWKHFAYKAVRTAIPAGETVDLAFPVAGTTANPLKEGMLYRAELVNPIPNTTDTLRFEDGTAEMAYLVVKPASLKAVAYDNGVLKLKGQWDPVLFLADTIAKKTAYAAATAYDLTEVQGVERVGVEGVNPNALFYVADDSKAEGRNVVRQGVCQQLELTTGFDFAPVAPFKATSATLTADASVAKWALLTMPFAASVPEGVAARRIDSHSDTGIAGKTTDVNTLSQGMTYMVMTSKKGTLSIHAENADVAAVPAENADTAVVGTFRNAELPEGAMTPNDAESQLFAKTQGNVEAFRGYFLAAGVERNFSAATNTTTDPAYLILAQNINKAYTILHRYSSLVPQEAYDEYLTAINEAEWEFTHRNETQLNSSAAVKNYAARLLEMGDEYMRKITKAGNVEIEFSSSITNPSFEMKSANGWTLTKPLNPNITASTAARVYANTSLNYLTVGTDGGYLLNNMYIYTDANGKRDTLGVGISQQLTGLLPGCYRLTAMLGSDTGNSITLFAGDSRTTVDAHSFGRHYFAEASVDSIVVEAGEDGTGSLTIGVEPGSWYKADNFRLFYLGPKANGDDIKDAISTPTAIRHNAPKGIYTIQGLRLERITAPGIYIIDGKKTIIK